MIVRNIGTGRTKVSGAGATGRWRAVVPATLAVLLLILPSAFLFAQDASVTYLEGDPEVRTAAGATDWLDFGSSVRPGDSVVTGRWDFVELTQGAAATIRVNADTVFTIREVERDGRRETVMSNSVGSVSYRFQRVTGRAEPRVGTATTVAGVRGTELTVFAASDGSSMFLVETGEVEVSSAGQSVSLTADQAVEVVLGYPPGEIFEWLGRPKDFRSWNNERIEAFVDAPAEGTAMLTQQLDEFIQGYAEFRELYERIREEYNAMLETLREMDPSEERDAFRDEVFDTRDITVTQARNYRYFALSGLSLRRFVLGRMYVELKTRYMLNRNDPKYQAFLEEYQRFLESYEAGITPGLVDADI